MTFSRNPTGSTDSCGRCRLWEKTNKGSRNFYHKLHYIIDSSSYFRIYILSSKFVLFYYPSKSMDLTMMSVQVFLKTIIKFSFLMIEKGEVQRAVLWWPTSGQHDYLLFLKAKSRALSNDSPSLFHRAIFILNQHQ